MFGNIGWAELVIIVIAGLVILGPERLPGAMSWLARSIKQVRAYATGAQTQLRDELGPEFEDLRKPLSELQQLRGMTPRAAITKHLLDGDDSIFTGEFDEPAGNGNGSSAHSNGTGTGSNGAAGTRSDGRSVHGDGARQARGSAAPGHRPASAADGNGQAPPGQAEHTGPDARPAPPGGAPAYDDDAT